ELANRADDGDPLDGGAALERLEAPREQRASRERRQRLLDAEPEPLALAAAQEERPDLHRISTARPPVMRTRSAGASRNSAFGCPAAAHRNSRRSRSASTKVSRVLACPSGGMPPIAKPVWARTKSGSALASGSPRS